MSDSEERRKGKHLDWQDRQEIQKGLRERRSFREIADIIGCSPDTISKEIRCHRYHKERKSIPGSYVKPNRCKYRDNCRRRDVCQKKKGHKCRIPCRECLRCNELCPDFVDAPCQIDHKAPYVCNGCPKSRSCLFDHYVYSGDHANYEYQEKLRSARMGIDLSKDEFAALDDLVSPLIRKGQPIAHIMAAHRDEIPCSERTVYRYIEIKALTAQKMDLRRAVRYKKRKHYVDQPKVSYRKKTGHHYKDYLEYMQEHPDARVVQMDTVEGQKGGKVLQTLLWPENNLMLMFLLDSKSMAGTVATFDRLEAVLGAETFRKMFPVILTDNGCEFADPELFEKGLNGTQRTRLYYCEARHSEQKGEIEKNHEYIRYVLPKGKPFDGLTEEQVLLLENHINNTARPQLHGSTPMKEALRTFDKNALDALGLYVIQPDDICLRPELLK